MELCEKDNTSSGFDSFLHNTIRELYHRVLQPEQPYWSLICIFKNLKQHELLLWFWNYITPFLKSAASVKKCIEIEGELEELTVLRGQMPMDLQKNLIDSSFHHAALLYCVT